MTSSNKPKKKKPTRSFSPEVKRKSSKDKVYFKELSDIISLHEIEVAKRKNHSCLLYLDYNTSKGLIRIYSIFTYGDNLAYSYISFLDELENALDELSTFNKGKTILE